MNTSTLDALAIRRDDRILEIGFGGGALLEAILLAEPDFVAGVEISDLALTETKRRLASVIASGRLELATNESEDLPFEAGAFSKVCCVNVVYFWDDPVAWMSEVHRVLQPGGRFVLCYQEAGPNDRKTPPERIEEALANAGFDVIQTDRGRDRHNGEFCCTTAQR